jgi:glycosyltransferase involved in cell wall biosynthesis
LADAVESVFAQTYSALECIVVDDGSTDETNEVLEKLQTLYPCLKTAKKTNGGPSSARNVGLRLCSGNLISFLDADDVLIPEKIERQVKFLSAHPDVGVVYGDYLVVTEDLHPIAVFVAEMPQKLDSIDAFCYRNWFNPLVPLIRRTVIEQVGEFDEALAVAEDWDFWIRCAKVARMSYLAGPVAFYRQHGAQMHRQHFRMRSACIQVAEKCFRETHKRFRIAMAGIEWTHARYLWKQRERLASVLALMNFALKWRCGLRRGSICGQLEAISKSQLEPLPPGRLELLACRRESATSVSPALKEPDF